MNSPSFICNLSLQFERSNYWKSYDLNPRTSWPTKCVLSYMEHFLLFSFTTVFFFPIILVSINKINSFLWKWIFKVRVMGWNGASTVRIKVNLYRSVVYLLTNRSWWNYAWYETLIILVFKSYFLRCRQIMNPEIQNIILHFIFVLCNSGVRDIYGISQYMFLYFQQKPSCYISVNSTLPTGYSRAHDI